MKSSDSLLDAHIHFEGLKLRPYLCPAGIPTIGIGMTFYPNGRKVTLNDTPLASGDEAIRIYKLILEPFEKTVTSLTKGVNLTQNQFDALVDFQFNTGALGSSNLLKVIKKNPKDSTIWGEFMKWTKVKADNDGKDNDGDGLIDEEGEKKELLGLVRRRNFEAHLFVLGSINYYENLK
jgi:lysozyme